MTRPIEATGLTKSFGEVVAVDGVTRSSRRVGCAYSNGGGDRSRPDTLRVFIRGRWRRQAEMAAST